MVANSTRALGNRVAMPELGVSVLSKFRCYKTVAFMISPGGLAPIPEGSVTQIWY